jgi:hypothetical protein
LYASARFRDRTDESYHGSGPDSLRDDRAKYRIKDVLGEIVTGHQLTKKIGFTVKAGYLKHSLAKGRSGPPLEEEFLTPSGSLDESLPGSLIPPNYVVTHTSFLVDYRDDPGVTLEGVMIAFRWEKFDNTNSDNLPKRAIDTFFRRAGDILSAALVCTGTTWLACATKHSALTCFGLAIVRLIFEVMIGLGYKNWRLFPSPPDPCRFSRMN